MENTWDLVENTIKIENRFRLDVTDFIRTIYKTRKNSILPYDINTEDVFEMLQDLTWTDKDNFVVFFNFEFIMCLMKLGVTPNRITYIAPSKESFYVVQDRGWGKLGMKSILFDLGIYKKYQNRKQWKKYLMKKIGKLDEFIGVGNIPFTVNSTDSTNSKKIGNDFIKLMNEFQQSCYILPAKFDSKTFKEDLILNPKLKKVTYHEKPLFDIEQSYKTCHVLLNGEHGNEFTYTSNATSEIEILKKVKNLELSKIIGKSLYVDGGSIKLSDIWVRGNFNDNDLKSDGKYKVVNKIGNNTGRDDFSFLYHDLENTGYGKWKVLIPNVTNGWAVKVAGPEYSISYSIVGFEVKDKESAYKLKDFLLNDGTIKLIKSLKTSAANTKTLFSKITLPNGII
jgi:hypothetical protein